MRSIASIIILIALVACERSTITSATSTAPQAITSAITSTGASAGTLIAGNVGDDYITLFVNGRAYESIAPRNEIALDLAAGFYLITFEASADYVESSSGAPIDHCTYTDLQIIAQRSTGAYCAR